MTGPLKGAIVDAMFVCTLLLIVAVVVYILRKYG